MKIKLLLACTLALATTITIDGFYNYSYTYSTGAPAGNTGSVGDGQTCSRSGCHSGAVPTVSGWITENIEDNGYTPNETYQITATAMENGRSKFGFEITAEDGSGNKLGTFTITNSSETQLASSNDNFVTHTSGGTAGTNQKSWTFDWTAPGSGNGAVTFCAAFNAADGANGSAGDNISMECLTIQENTINPGIFENNQNSINVTTFPNPAVDVLNIHYTVDEKSLVTADLYTLEGKLVQNLFAKEQLSGSFETQVNLNGYSVIKNNQAINHGVYFLKLAIGNKTTMRKIIITQ